MSEALAPLQSHGGAGMELTYRPHVHIIDEARGSQQDLQRSVPSRSHILCEDREGTTLSQGRLEELACGPHVDAIRVAGRS